MELTKELLASRTWVQLDIAPEDWPNQRSTPDERRFYTTIDGKEPITVRYEQFYQACRKHGLRPEYV